MLDLKGTNSIEWDSYPKSLCCLQSMPWLTRPHIPEGREGIAARRFHLSGKATFFFQCRHMFWAEEASVCIPHAPYNEVEQRGSAVTCICLCAPLYCDRQSPTDCTTTFPYSWMSGLHQTRELCLQEKKKKNLLTQKHLYFDIKRNGLIKKQNKKYIKNILKKTPKKRLVDWSSNP